MLKVGDFINNNSTVYEVLDFVEDRIILKSIHTGTVLENVHTYWINNRLEDGSVVLYYIEVNNTKLARKLYPDAEILENGKLRIKA